MYPAPRAGGLDPRVLRCPAAVVEHDDDSVRLRKIRRPLVLGINHRPCVWINRIDPPRQVQTSRQELMISDSAMRAVGCDKHNSLRALRRIFLAIVIVHISLSGEGKRRG